MMTEFGAPCRLWLQKSKINAAQASHLDRIGREHCA
jgi:hypothetical protein